MFFAIVFSAFALFCCLIAYSAITFRRFLAFVLGPPRFEPFDHAAEMEEVVQVFTGQRSIQVDEMRLGEPGSEQEQSIPGSRKSSTDLAPTELKKLIPVSSKPIR